jgi:hypothetical protein
MNPPSHGYGVAGTNRHEWVMIFTEGNKANEGLSDF